MVSSSGLARGWRWLLAGVALLALCGVSLVAGAEEVAEATEAAAQPINPFLFLGAVVTSYLLAYLLLTWLTKRYGFVSGVFFVVLGILVVPLMGWLEAEILHGLEAVLSVGIGAVAFTAGLSMNRRRLKDQDSNRVKLALTVVGVTILLVAVLPLIGVSRWVPEGEQLPWVVGLLVLCSIALVADGRQLMALADFFDVDETQFSDAVELCWLTTSLGILGFGLFMAAMSPGVTIDGGYLDMGLWLLVHLAVAGILGGLGAALMDVRPDDDRALTILLGVLISASAAAFAMGLSIVFVCFVAGAVMINLSSESLRLKTMLEGAHVPLYILLLFLAGTFWTPGMAPVGYALIAGYLVLKLFGRALGVALYRPRLSGNRPQPGLHRALWAPGALTAAMILDFGIQFSALDQIHTILSALVLILIAEEVIAYGLSRSWMIDISDAARRRQTTSPWGDWRGGRS